MIEKYILAIERFRWLVVFVALVFVLVAAKGIGRIEIHSDFKGFMDPQYPPLVKMEEVQDIFSENHNLLVVIAPQDGVIFKAETIRLIQQMTEQFWLTPYAARVDSLTNFQHTQVIGDDLIVGDLLPANKSATSLTLDQASEVARTEPFLVNNFISLQQHVAVISINFDIPEGERPSAVNDEANHYVNERIKDFSERYPHTKFHLTGVVKMDHAMNAYSKKDAVTLIPAMMILMVIILLIMTRSFSGIFSAAIVVICTGVGSMGLLGWYGWIIDLGSAISPIVIMTLAVADSIHVIEGMQKGLRQGMPKQEAIGQSLRDNFAPVFLTSLTTVFGVITFSFAEIASLQRLGITVAVGVSVAFVLSVTLLPAMLSILPMKVGPERKKTAIFAHIAELTIRHYKLIVVLGIAVSVALIALAPLNRFNDTPSAMLATYTPERQAIDFLEDNVSGVLNMDVAIFTGKEGEVNNPEFLAKMDQFVNWLRQQNNVEHVATLTDTFKRLNQQMHGGDTDWYKLPVERDLAAQYLLLYEMSLPYGLDLNNQLNIDKSAIRMLVVLDRGDTQQIVEAKWAIEAWFADNAPQLEVLVTGATPLMSELSYVHLIPDMMTGGMIAILMVSFVLFLTLRSFKLGFVGMLANILPVSVGYGVWYLINGEVNFFIASVAGVCLGVVVDFVVHFLSKYQRSRKAGGSTEEAIRFAFDKTGRPLWTTMIVLVSGFWLLMFSPIALNAGVGTLTGIIILLALLFDFFVLPSLLMIIDKKDNLTYAVDIKPKKNN